MDKGKKERSCRWWEENGEVGQLEVSGKVEELSPWGYLTERVLCRGKDV